MHVEFFLLVAGMWEVWRGGTYTRRNGTKGGFCRAIQVEQKPPTWLGVCVRGAWGDACEICAVCAGMWEVWRGGSGRSRNASKGGFCRAIQVEQKPPTWLGVCVRGAWGDAC